MTTIREVLDKHRVDLTEDDLATELDHALRALSAPRAAPLTAGEIDYLTTHAGGTAAAVITTWDPTREHKRRTVGLARTVKQLVTESLSRAEAAKLLGVDPSGVSRRVKDKALWTYRVGSRARIPSWQFADGAPLPGLPLVVPAIPEGASALDVSALMNTTQDELGGRTPARWLAEGCDPAPVAELLADLNRW